MGDWREILKALIETDLGRFEHLKVAMAAQWLLESGRGTSRLFREHWNPAGMKWRDELAGIGTKVWYATTTEPFRFGPNGREQGDWFASFPSAQQAVQGYLKFLDRPPYHGWKERAATPMSWFDFIGPIWCPAGYTQPWIQERGGLNYGQMIMAKIYPEALSAMSELGYKQTIQEVSEGTWIEFNRTESGRSCATVYDSKGNALTNLWAGEKSLLVEDLSKLFASFPKAKTALVAETGKKAIPDAPKWPEVKDSPKQPEPPVESGKMAGKKILLAPGHSTRQPGVFGKGPNPPSEYDMNVLQSKIIAERLRAHGATVTINDPENDDLAADAMKAKGYDLYLVPHHNAANKDGVDEGTETYVHPQANEECRRLAGKIQAAIVKALGSRDRGVKTANFMVLRIAHYQTDCILNILPESYFIDDYWSKEEAAKRSTAAANAMADAIISHFT